MRRIDCPYCLTPQTFRRSDICEACNQRVPHQYIEIARAREPIWIVAYGPPKHGKSSLLSSTTFLVEHLGMLAPHAFHTYLDDRTITRIAAAQHRQRTGQGPEPVTTLVDKPEPLLIALRNFPKDNDSQVLVIFDLGGELAVSITQRLMVDRKQLPMYTRALAKAKTVWFIVSLYDIQKDMVETGKSINNLFFGYEQTMGHLGAPLDGHDILVTYTKADKLLSLDTTNLLTLPDLISDYLRDDPYYNLGNPGTTRPPLLDADKYVEEMGRISQELDKFTRYSVPEGQALVSMADGNRVNIRFTMNSALGSDNGAHNTTGTQIRRFRVLDTLLWALQLNNTVRHTASAALILPAQTQKGSSILDLATAVADILHTNNIHADTYHVGETRPAAAADNASGEKQRAGRVPLVGPILDRLPADCIVIILADEVLPLDLDDFYVTSWDNKLLLLGTDKAVMNARASWKSHVLSSDDVDSPVESFLQYHGGQGVQPSP